VVKFKAATDPATYICNQSRITLLDGDGNTIFINSDDTTQSGSQHSTCFYTDGVLPLSKLAFSGSLNNSQSVLKWSLRDETNVAWYELEYADQPSHFKTVGKQVAESNAAGDYRFIDKINTTDAARFYRIKIVQKGGSYSYSGIIFLSVKEVGLQVYPNPFQKEINIQLKLRTADLIKFRLVDFYGKEVFAASQSLGAGYHSVSLLMPSGLVKGMYVMEVLTGSGQLFQQKLLHR
jgi:hypothetical protein